MSNIFISTPENENGLLYLITYHKLACLLRQMGHTIIRDIKKINECNLAILMSKWSAKKICKICSEINIPVILFPENISEFTKENNNNKVSLKHLKLFNKVDEIVCDTQIEKDFYITNGVTKPINIIKVLKPKLYKNNISELENQVIRRVFRISEGTNIIVLYGRLSIDEHVKMANVIARTFPDWKFFFVDSKVKPTDLDESMQKNSKNLNLSFIGYLRPEIYPSLLANTFLFINFDSYFGNTSLLSDLVENEIPIISSNLIFYSDSLEKGKDYIELNEDFSLFFNEIKSSLSNGSECSNNIKAKLKDGRGEIEYKKLQCLIERLISIPLNENK